VHASMAAAAGFSGHAADILEHGLAQAEPAGVAAAGMAAKFDCSVDSIPTHPANTEDDPPGWLAVAAVDCWGSAAFLACPPPPTAMLTTTFDCTVCCTEAVLASSVLLSPPLPSSPPLTFIRRFANAERKSESKSAGIGIFGFSLSFPP
jgi:hypothetical protein